MHFSDTFFICPIRFLYSWNIGYAHIISFSTEVNFFTEYGHDVIKNQMAFLEADLKVRI